MSTWILAAILILLVWASLFAYLELEKRDDYEHMERVAINFARVFDEHVARTIRGIDQTTLFVKSQVEDRSQKFDLRLFAQKGGFIDQYYNLIAIVDSDGWVKQVNRPLPPSKVSDREHFQVHVKDGSGGLFISKPVLGRSSGAWSVQFTRRINKADGSFDGIVVTSLDPEYFINFYKSVDLGKGAAITLVGLDGVVRARRSSADSTVSQNISDSEFFRQVSMSGKNEGAFFSKSPFDGVNRLHAFSKLGEYPLAVVVSISEEVLKEEDVQHLRLAETIGSVFTLLVIVSALILTLLLRSQAKTQEAMVLSEQEALSASRMKSELLARMSHELRTPLNGILGLSEYLKGNHTEGEVHEVATTIHEAGQHLLSLVNTMLDLAKIEAGRMTLDIREEALKPLIDKVCALHRGAASQKGLTVSLVLEQNLPQTICCDTTKLIQILNNLVHNAIKFTEQGSITLSVGLAENGKDILFSVRDSGRGIPKNQQHLIFDRFRQLDSFETRSQEGSGLGLALVKDLVELMGGKIWFDSQFGTGTTFFFTLKQ